MNSNKRKVVAKSQKFFQIIVGRLTDAGYSLNKDDIKNIYESAISSLPKHHLDLKQHLEVSSNSFELFLNCYNKKSFSKKNEELLASISLNDTTNLKKEILDILKKSSDLTNRLDCIKNLIKIVLVKKSSTLIHTLANTFYEYFDEEFESCFEKNDDTHWSLFKSTILNTFIILKDNYSLFEEQESDSLQDDIMPFDDIMNSVFSLIVDVTIVMHQSSTNSADCSAAGRLLIETAWVMLSKSRARFLESLVELSAIERPNADLVLSPVYDYVIGGEIWHKNSLSVKQYLLFVLVARQAKLLLNKNLPAVASSVTSKARKIASPQDFYKSVFRLNGGEELLEKTGLLPSTSFLSTTKYLLDECDLEILEQLVDLIASKSTMKEKPINQTPSNFLFELNKQPTIADNDSMPDVNKTQTTATKQDSGSDDDSADELLKDTQYLLDPSKDDDFIENANVTMSEDDGDESSSNDEDNDNKNSANEDDDDDEVICDAIVDVQVNDDESILKTSNDNNIVDLVDNKMQKSRKKASDDNKQNKIVKPRIKKVANNRKSENISPNDLNSALKISDNKVSTDDDNDATAVVCKSSPKKSAKKGSKKASKINKSSPEQQQTCDKLELNVSLERLEKSLTDSIKSKKISNKTSLVKIEKATPSIPKPDNVDAQFLSSAEKSLNKNSLEKSLKRRSNQNQSKSKELKRLMKLESPRSAEKKRRKDKLKLLLETVGGSDIVEETNSVTQNTNDASLNKTPSKVSDNLCHSQKKRNSLNVSGDDVNTPSKSLDHVDQSTTASSKFKSPSQKAEQLSNTPKSEKVGKKISRMNNKKSLGTGDVDEQSRKSCTSSEEITSPNKQRRNEVTSSSKKRKKKQKKSLVSESNNDTADDSSVASVFLESANESFSGFEKEVSKEKPGKRKSPEVRKSSSKKRRGSFSPLQKDSLNASMSCDDSSESMMDVGISILQKALDDAMRNTERSLSITVPDIPDEVSVSSELKNDATNSKTNKDSEMLPTKSEMRIVGNGISSPNTQKKKSPGKLKLCIEDVLVCEKSKSPQSDDVKVNIEPESMQPNMKNNVLEVIYEVDSDSSSVYQTVESNVVKREPSKRIATTRRTRTESESSLASNASSIALRPRRVSQDVTAEVATPSRRKSTRISNRKRTDSESSMASNASSVISKPKRSSRIPATETPAKKSSRKSIASQRKRTDSESSLASNASSVMQQTYSDNLQEPASHGYSTRLRGRRNVS